MQHAVYIEPPSTSHVISCMNQWKKALSGNE